MSALKKGTAVRQVLPAPIEGVVTSFSVDSENGERLTKVAYINEEGDEMSRFFKDSEIEEVVAEEPDAG